MSFGDQTGSATEPLPANSPTPGQELPDRGPKAWGRNPRPLAETLPWKRESGLTPRPREGEVGSVGVALHR